MDSVIISCYTANPKYLARSQTAAYILGIFRAENWDVSPYAPEHAAEVCARVVVGYLGQDHALNEILKPRSQQSALIAMIQRHLIYITGHMPVLVTINRLCEDCGGRTAKWAPPRVSAAHPIVPKYCSGCYTARRIAGMISRTDNYHHITNPKKTIAL